MSNFFRSIKYHWKRTLAIFFLGLAVAFEIAYFIIGMVQMLQSGSYSVNTFSFIWNFAILMICYVTMLLGNLRNSYSAYRGVLSFVFLSTILLIFDVIYDLFDLGFASSVTALGIEIGIIAAMVGEIVLGVFCYLRLQGYLTGRYVNLRRLKLLFGLFLGFLIISNGLYIGLVFYELGLAISTLTIFLLLLSPISELFAAVGTWVTIARLDE